MATGKTGSIEIAGSKGISMRVNWEETYAIETNESTVTIKSIECMATWYYGVTYYLEGTVSINGETAINMGGSKTGHKFSPSSLNAYRAISGEMGSVVVGHDSDGSKSVSISVDVFGYTTNGSNGSGWDVDWSEVIELTTIPRASTITSASDVILGGACCITWTPLADSFGFRLKFDLGEFSHTTDLIQPNTNTAYTYNGYVIPLDVAYQITGKPKDEMTVTLYSYLGEDQVGEADTEVFTVTVPDNEHTKPTVDMELSLVSELSAPFDSLYIQNLTKVGADINAEGQYGAGIESCQMVIGGSSYGNPFVSGYITHTGEVTVTGKATDSRGCVGKVEQTISVIPYSKPAIVPAEGETSIVCVRCDENGYITDSGTYLKIKAKRSYSYVESDGVQHNFCQFRYRCDGGGWVLIPSDSDELEIELAGVVSSTTKAYTIEVGVVDDIGYEASVLIIVPSDKVEFHLREGGDGAAFGEYAEDARVLAVAESWELRVKGTMTIGGKSLLDMFYPVGSIYMSVNATNPATFLGGTWGQMGSADFADYIWKRTE